MKNCIFILLILFSNITYAIGWKESNNSLDYYLKLNYQMKEIIDMTSNNMDGPWLNDAGNGIIYTLLAPEPLSLPESRLVICVVTFKKKATIFPDNSTCFVESN